MPCANWTKRRTKGRKSGEAEDFLAETDKAQKRKGGPRQQARPSSFQLTFRQAPSSFVSDLRLIEQHACAERFGEFEGREQAEKLLVVAAAHPNARQLAFHQVAAQDVFEEVLIIGRGAQG
jgi:hypothetical protein